MGRRRDEVDFVLGFIVGFVVALVILGLAAEMA